MKDLTGINAPIALQESDEIKLIVAALGEIAPGTQASADFFNQGLPDEHHFRVSRISVWSWCNGSFRVSDKRLRFWRAIFPETDVRHQLALNLLALRERAEEVHWVGKPAGTLSEAEGKKLLEAVKVKKGGK